MVCVTLHERRVDEGGVMTIIDRRCRDSGIRDSWIRGAEEFDPVASRLNTP